MSIDFSMCKKHGVVRHTVTSTCNLCSAEQVEPQTTDTQQLKAEILQYLNMALGAINGSGTITAEGYIKQAIAKLSPVA